MTVSSLQMRTDLLVLTFDQNGVHECTYMVVAAGTRSGISSNSSDIFLCYLLKEKENKSAISFSLFARLRGGHLNFI